MRRLLDHLLLVNRTKKVVVVADDVDPADLEAVEWSIVTRSQPDADVVVRSGLPGHPIDPSCLPDSGSRRGLASTRPGFDHDQSEGRSPSRARRWAKAECRPSQQRKAPSHMMRLIVGISGASGTVYGVRLLEVLKDSPIETHLVMTERDQAGHQAGDRLQRRGHRGPGRRGPRQPRHRGTHRVGLVQDDGHGRSPRAR